MKLNLKKLINKKFENPHKFYGALCNAGAVVSYQSVLNWMNGTPPNANNIPYISKVLDVPISAFF